MPGAVDDGRPVILCQTGGHFFLVEFGWVFVLERNGPHPKGPQITNLLGSGTVDAGTAGNP